MRIAFVGEEAAGARALRCVVDSDHEPVVVLTDSSRAGGRSTVAGLATDHGVPIEPARRVREPVLADDLRARGVDVLLNVHALHIVRPEVLAAPRVGAFNLHPGPLPDYAGLNAPSWAILHGRTSHGVTLHWMEPGIDMGDVVARTDFDLGPTDTGLSVALRCAQKGVELVDELLATLSHDPPAVPRQRQDLGRRCYYGREVPFDGWIPWDAPARQVLDFVRACDYRPFASPWGTPRTAAPGTGTVGVERLAPTDVAADRTPGTVCVEESAVLVATADRWVRVLGVRVEGQALPPAEVLTDGTVLVASS